MVFGIFSRYGNPFNSQFNMKNFDEKEWKDINEEDEENDFNNSLLFFDNDNFLLKLENIKYL